MSSARTSKEELLASTMSRGSARANLAASFRDAGIESADLDARLLVCAACGVSHLDLIGDPDRPLGEATAARLNAFADRRLLREPVSRILGRREFWGLSFVLDPSVLDPRPDTEGLVGAVIDSLGGRRPAPLRLLDLGTGSGAILAALLHEMPGAFGIALDRSFEACRVAKANLRALGLDERAVVICGDWAAPLDGRFDAIVSNPPYIPSDDIAGLASDVRHYDPLSALDGGDDGLDAYRALLPDLPMRLAPGGIAAVECGWNQGERVAALFRGAGFATVSIYRDLANHQRVVVAQAHSSGATIAATEIPWRTG